MEYHFVPYFSSLAKGHLKVKKKVVEVRDVSYIKAVDFSYKV